LKKRKIGYLLLFFIAFAFVYTYVLTFGLGKTTGTTMEVIPMALGAVSALILYLWMVINLIINWKSTRLFGLWLFFMVFANWVTAIVYFLAIFNKNQQSNKV